MPMKLPLLSILLLGATGQALAQANLSFLDTYMGGMAPKFSPEVTSYTQEVPHSMADFPLWALPTDPQAKLEVSVNGGAFTRLTTGNPIAAGPNCCYAITADGSVLGWGQGVKIPDGASAGVISIAASTTGLWALKADGSLVTSSQNTSDYGGTDYVAVAANQFSYALKSNGSIHWLDNWHSESTTMPPILSSGIVAVAAGNMNWFATDLALRNDGSVVQFHFGPDAQNGMFRTVPAEVLTDVVAIATGGSDDTWNGQHFLALKRNGSVVAWGSNGSGESTVPPSARSGVVAITAGDRFSLALKNNGTVVGWGLNTSGQLDSYGTDNTAISAGLSHGMALKSTGSITVRGSNTLGQHVPAGVGSLFFQNATGPSSPLPLALNLGPNTVLLRVTSKDGLEVKNYSLTVTRRAAPGSPEITVYDSTPGAPGAELSHNTGNLPFDGFAGGPYPARDFTITNAGTDPLTGIVLTLPEGGGYYQTSPGGLSQSYVSGFFLGYLEKNSLLPGESTTFRLFFPSQGGLERTGKVAIISNDSDESSFEINVSGKSLTYLGKWRLDNFGKSEATGSADDVSDVDGDGVPNLLEYISMSNPTLGNGSPLTLGIEGSFLTVTYRRNENIWGDGIKCSVQWCDDLKSPNWSTIGVTETLSNNAINGAYVVKAKVPLGTVNRYARLVVTRP